MSQKRAAMSLDPAAFAGVAIPQPDPVQAAVAKSAPPMAAAPEHEPIPKTELAAEPAQQRAVRSKPESRASAQQKSRVGKVAVQTWVSEDKRRRLKILSATTGVPVEDYLEGCIDDLLKRHHA